MLRDSRADVFVQRRRLGSAFSGGVAAALKDRNTIDFCIDGGLTILGGIPERPDDAVGVGIADANCVRVNDAAVFGVRTTMNF